MLSRNNKREVILNLATIAVAVVIVLGIAYSLPHRGNLTTIYFAGKAVTANDVRNACASIKPHQIVQIDPSITIDCGR